MYASKVGHVPDFTFVSIPGPALDNASAKAARAHITRANFARRRRRVVREYTDSKNYTAHEQPLAADEIVQTTDENQAAYVQPLVFRRPGLSS